LFTKRCRSGGATATGEEQTWSDAGRTGPALPLWSTNGNAPGFAFSKAEVLLLELCQRSEFTDHLFAPTQPVASDRLIAVLDSDAA